MKKLTQLWFDLKMRVKLILVFSFMIVMTALVLSLVNIYQTYQEINGDFVHNLEMSMQLAEGSVGHISSADEERLKEELERISEAVEGLAMTFEGNSAKLVGVAGTLEAPSQFTLTDDLVKQAMNSDKLTISSLETENQEYLLGLNPLQDDAGKTVGLWGIAVPTDEVRQEIVAKIWETIGVALFSLAWAVFWGFIISTSMTRPLKQVAKGMKRVEEGDLTEDIDFVAQDEIGQLTRSFNIMQDNMRNLIRQVMVNSDFVAKGSETVLAASTEGSSATNHIAQSVSQLALASEEQAKDIHEVGQVVEQLKAAIDQIAAGAGEQATHVMATSETVHQMVEAIAEINQSSAQVVEASEASQEAANQGSQAVNVTVEGMKRIQVAVFDAANQIQELGNHSEQIGQIIQVIDDIAEQTNLLALNAAIEAARAGEHGKGFAVVADQVRRLAEKSGQATKEIALLVQNMQSGTQKSIVAMDLGTSEVENGVTLATQAGTALGSIIGNINRATDVMQEIAKATARLADQSNKVQQAVDNVAAITEENSAATEEMAAGSTQVTRAMTNVAQTAQNNSSTAHQISAAGEEIHVSTTEIAKSAEHLVTSVLDLREIMGKFRVIKSDKRCWEVMKCSTEICKKCPASKTDEDRCWLIDHTWCGESEQGDAQEKRDQCMQCKYYRKSMGLEV